MMGSSLGGVGPLLFEDLLKGLLAFGGGVFLARGDGAERGIESDVFDGFGGRCGGSSGQVAGCDLERVEDKGSAAAVDAVGGDALDDLADRELDCAAVFGCGHGECLLAAAALGEVLDGAAGFVVEVAEVLVAEGDAAAAVASGVDVTALKAAFVGGDDLWSGFEHGEGPLPPVCCAKF